MSLTAPIFEINASGSDTNGGFFDSSLGGTDYSQATTAQLSLTDVVTTGTTTVTSVTGGFTAAMLGNGFNIAGVLYEITAVGGLGTITVDRATGTGTGQVGKVGGAMATPGFALGALITATRTGKTLFYCKGAQSITVNTANIASGKLNNTLTTNNTSNVRWIGYATTRGDNVIQVWTLGASMSGTAFAIAASGSVTHCEVANIEIDAGSSSVSTAFSGFSTGALSRAFNCITKGAFTGFNGVGCFGCYCEGVGVAGTGFSGGYAVFCYAKGLGIGFAASGITNFCVANACNLGWSLTGAVQVTVMNSIAYASVSHGFSFTNADQGGVVHNLIAVNNGGWGINLTNTNFSSIGNIATYNNTSGAISNGTYLNYGGANVTLGADPFTSGSTGDFTLNATAYASLKLAGFPTNLPGTAKAMNTFIGAIPYIAAAGGIKNNDFVGGFRG